MDKQKNPIVHSLRITLLVFANFSQTLGVGIPVNIGSLTQAVQNAIQKRIDLEIARAVNALLRPSVGTLSDGRCPNDWHPFTGN